MDWSDPNLIVGVVACAAAVIAALYAYLPYRAHRRAVSRDQFVDERQYLNDHRASLTAMALAEGGALVWPSLPGMLWHAEWIPSRPIPLAGISLKLNWDELPAPLDAGMQRLRRRSCRGLNPQAVSPTYQYCGR
jgi:hypothetical protein